MEFYPPLYDSQHVVTNLEICISSEGNEWMRCRKFAKRGHLRLKLLWPINYPQPSLFAKLIQIDLEIIKSGWYGVSQYWDIESNNPCPNIIINGDIADMKTAINFA